MGERPATPGLQARLFQGSRKQCLERLWRILYTDSLISAGVSGLFLLCCIALFAGTLAPHDPTRTGLGKRLRPGVWTNQGGVTFPLGTDHLGRDVLSRLLYGSRISLGIGFGSVAVAALLGTTLGCLAGYWQGIIARLILGWVALQSIFPGFLLALSVLTLIGTSPLQMILVLALSNWVWYARVAHDIMVGARTSLLAEATQALGSVEGRIFRKHCLPNLTMPLLILSLQEVARMVLLEASLSFFGFGAQPPTPAWGLMLAESRHYFPLAPWLGIFAGLALGITVLSLYLVAGWLGAVSDSQQRYRLWSPASTVV